MNRKFLSAAVVGVAGIALAVGGATYAAWSDSSTVTGNNTGAGTLTLTVGPNLGQDLIFDHLTMAPGNLDSERQVFIASNDGTSTPSAKLFVQLQNLVGTEDGCHGDELADDSNCADTSSSNQGQFVQDATVQWYSYVPDSPGVCNQSYSPAMKTVTPQHGPNFLTLAAQTATTPYELTGSGQAYKLPWLAPGAGVCFAMSVGLGYGVDNASQGDSVSFDLHFTLEQAPYGTPTTPADPVTGA